MSRDIRARHHVVESGQPGGRPMLFAHGFGSDQRAWRFVAPAFEHSHRVIVFDHVGCGQSDASFHDPVRHATVDGYAQDLIELCEALDLHDVICVGHSVGAMIGALASIHRPQRFAHLVMICPSPRYLNDPPHYIGGFERHDIDGMLDMMERNLLGFANFLAPVVMGPGTPDRLTHELEASLSSADPDITRRFARATFMIDVRERLADVSVPSLVLQCGEDTIAPREVGEYLQSRLGDSRLRTLAASGHCPHMSHPAQTVDILRDELGLTVAPV